MRYLILSDIHANIVAFEAVLQHADKRRWDKLIFLGDAVGYYPAPEATVRTLQALEPSVAILGNHDAMVLELMGKHQAEPEIHEMARSNGTVGMVIRHHHEQLSPESLAFLAALDDRYVSDNRSWEATHGSFYQPWAYLSSLLKAQQHFPLMETRLCFVGHTHVPVVFGEVTHHEARHYEVKRAKHHVRAMPESKPETAPQATPPIPSETAPESQLEAASEAKSEQALVPDKASSAMFAAPAAHTAHTLWRTVAIRKEHVIYRIPPQGAYICNPGSVGQPRDGIPLASYAIFDVELQHIEFFRVAFDVYKVQHQVLEHGYPEALARRLVVGR